MTADTTTPTPLLPDQEIRPASNTGSDIDDQAIQFLSYICSARTTTPDEPHVPPTAAHSTTNPIAPDPRLTLITIKNAIDNFPPAARIHPVTVEDNGAIMARYLFAQRPTPYPRLIHNGSNPPDNDGGDSDGPPSLISDSDSDSESDNDNDSDGAFSHHPGQRHQPSKLSHTTKPEMVSNNGRNPTHTSLDNT